MVKSDNWDITTMGARDGYKAGSGYAEITGDTLPELWENVQEFVDKHPKYAAKKFRISEPYYSLEIEWWTPIGNVEGDAKLRLKKKNCWVVRANWGFRN